MITQVTEKNLPNETEANLKDTFSDSESLSSAIKSNDLAWIQKLIANKASPLQKSSDGFSAFDHAVFLKDEKAISNLFSLHQDEYKNSSASYKTYRDIKKTHEQSCLLASQNGLISQFILQGNLPVMSSYLRNSPYIFDLNPKTALSSMHIAALGDSTEMIDLLLAHGFLIDEKDKNGRTPLHYAALNKNEEIFLAFLKKGAHILQVDDRGVSPLDLLVEKSRIIDPLNIPFDHKLSLLTLLITKVLETGVSLNAFGCYGKSFEEVLTYLTPLSQIAFMLQGSSYSKKMILLSTSLHLIAQNFTLSRLALNTFLVAKAAISCINGLKEIYTYGNQRPFDTFKKVSVRAITSSFIGNKFYKQYSFSFFKNLFNDFISLNETFFFETEIGEETQDELRIFSSVIQSHIEDYSDALTSLFNSCRQYFAEQADN